MRNTPTHVGKTMKHGGAFAVGKKPPHARGEDRLALPSVLWAAETPPRTWGRPIEAVVKGAVFGNTPTHVGKTNRKSETTRRLQKHPHARGEDFLSDK